MRMQGINSKVPNKEAEVALLKELYKAGGELDRAILISRAMSHFPQIQTDEERNRQTPSGHPWWEGRFSFDLSRLKNEERETENVKRCRWRITPKGIHRLRQSGCLIER